MQAQEEVMVGVGVLAGSSVMLLTIAWAGSLIAGRCDLTGSNGTATDLTLTRQFDPFGTGVTTDEQTRYPNFLLLFRFLTFVCNNSQKFAYFQVSLTVYFLLWL